ncbi:MAG: enoyl-CoA hydratase/isomerase family protein [Dehalococcoidia bacterium]|nr:enoyl-CoA hydratase/isomerase family protein [Dehalococcoidia bacterium]
MAPELVEYLLYEPEDSGILWIKFNRPERQNAIYVPESLAALAEYLKAGDADPKIRVIVITGVGKHFCAGVDLNPNAGMVDRLHGENSDSSRENFLYRTYPYFDAVSETMKPTIAMINGAAVGMGMDISLRCDIRMGCEFTRFFTYQNVGQIIENGGSYFLPKLAGLGRALELVYTGGFLQAEEAYRWGILNHLVPADQLEAETRALCQKIIASPPFVQWINKRIMRRALDVDLKTVQDLCANASGILFASEDAKEARTAWAEKRPPVFKGR